MDRKEFQYVVKVQYKTDKAKWGYDGQFPNEQAYQAIIHRIGQKFNPPKGYSLYYTSESGLVKVPIRTSAEFVRIVSEVIKTTKDSTPRHKFHFVIMDPLPLRPVAGVPRVDQPADVEQKPVQVPPKISTPSSTSAAPSNSSFGTAVTTVPVIKNGKAKDVVDKLSSSGPEVPKFRPLPVPPPPAAAKQPKARPSPESPSKKAVAEAQQLTQSAVDKLSTLKKETTPPPPSAQLVTTATEDALEKAKEATRNAIAALTSNTLPPLVSAPLVGSTPDEKVPTIDKGKAKEREEESKQKVEKTSLEGVGEAESTAGGANSNSGPSISTTGRLGRTQSTPILDNIVKRVMEMKGSNIQEAQAYAHLLSGSRGGPSLGATGRSSTSASNGAEGGDDEQRKLWEARQQKARERLQQRVLERKERWLEGREKSAKVSPSASTPASAPAPRPVSSTVSPSYGMSYGRGQISSDRTSDWAYGSGWGFGEPGFGFGGHAASIPPAAPRVQEDAAAAAAARNASPTRSARQYGGGWGRSGASGSESTGVRDEQRRFSYPVVSPSIATGLGLPAGPATAPDVTVNPSTPAARASGWFPGNPAQAPNPASVPSFTPFVAGWEREITDVIKNAKSEIENGVKKVIDEARTDFSDLLKKGVEDFVKEYGRVFEFNLGGGEVNSPGAETKKEAGEEGEIKEENVLSGKGEAVPNGKGKEKEKEGPARMPGAYVEEPQKSAAANAAAQEKADVRCSACKAPINGIRSTCMDCANYDLCGSCYNTENMHGHRFRHGFYAPAPLGYHRDVPVKEESKKSEDKQAAPVEATKQDVEAVVHHGIICDRCEAHPIKGVRHKCVGCPDYDLCTPCYELNQREPFHGIHEFRAFDKPRSSPPATVYTHQNKKYPSNYQRYYTPGYPGRYPGRPQPKADDSLNEKPQKKEEDVKPSPPAAPAAPVAPPAPVRHGATCDLCGKVIFGIRYKCMHCPDYDSCSDCHKRVSDVHPSHSFFPITDQQSVKVNLLPEDKVKHRGVVCDGCNKPLKGIRYKCTHPDHPDYDLCANCESSPLNSHAESHIMLKIKQPQPFMPRGGHSSAVDAGIEAGRLYMAKVDSVREELEKRAAVQGSAQPVIPTVAHVSDGPGSDKVVYVDLDLSNLGVVGRPDQVLQEFHIPISMSSAGQSVKVSVPVPGVSPPTPSVEQPAVEEDSAPKSSEAVEEKAQDFEAVVVEKEVASVEAPTKSAGSPVAATPTEDPVKVDSEIRILPSLSVEFVDDITLPDGTTVPAGALANKVWKVRNSGTETWPAGSKLVFAGGHALTKAESFEVPVAAPGEEVEIEAKDLRMPETSGGYISFWRFAGPDGQRWGDKLWISIFVDSDHDSDRSANSGSMSSSSIVIPSMLVGNKVASAGTVTSAQDVTTNATRETDSQHPRATLTDEHSVASTDSSSDIDSLSGLSEPGYEVGVEDYEDAGDDYVLLSDDE